MQMMDKLYMLRRENFRENIFPNHSAFITIVTF